MVQAYRSLGRSVYEVWENGMRFYVFIDAWKFLVANDHYAGDGQRAKRHGQFN